MDLRKYLDMVMAPHHPGKWFFSTLIDEIERLEEKINILEETARQEGESRKKAMQDLQEERVKYNETREYLELD